MLYKIYWEKQEKDQCVTKCREAENYRVGVYDMAINKMFIHLKYFLNIRQWCQGSYFAGTLRELEHKYMTVIKAMEMICSVDSSFAQMEILTNIPLVLTCVSKYNVSISSLMNVYRQNRNKPAD